MIPPPHTDGEGPCRHEECGYLRAHMGPAADRCSSCWELKGRRHAVASNWDGYSFGHSGGHVAFLTVCSKCGSIDMGYVLGVEWSDAEMAKAKALQPPL